MTYTGPVVYLNGVAYGIAERVSTNVKAFAQDTGRWSQTGPPMAQLPSKMRKLIGVDPGWPQVGSDLSNAELRIAAELSQDQMFLDAFKLGWDLHTLSTCELFGYDYPPNREKSAIHTGPDCAEWRAKYAWEGEDDARRKFGKIFQFRTLYGGQPRTAYTIPGAAKLGLSRSELEQAGYRWLASHPKLNAFWEHHGTEAADRFVVHNIFGRRRVLCGQDPMSRWREGINHPIQSFVSDLVNTIVLETYAACNAMTYNEKGVWSTHPGVSQVRLCGQMHDSLLWAFPQARFDELKAMALEVAQRPRTFGDFTFQFPVSSYEKYPYERTV